MSWRNKSDKPTEPKTLPKDDPVGARGLIGRLTALKEFIGGLSLPPHPQRQMGYSEAIGWFVANRPQGNVQPRGGILRTALPNGGIEITLMFLDSTGQQVVSDSHGKPCARRFIVDELDDELTDAFGGTPLLLIS